MPFPWIPVLFATTAALSFMGSMRTMQTMNTAAQWEKYNQKINTSYKTIQANERARLLLSAKRAAQGARGVVIAQGSTLLEQEAVIDRLDDTLWWIEKGAEMDVRDIDLRLAGALQEEAWKAGTSLISTGLKYATYNA
jgi:hypothetical protein